MLQWSEKQNKGIDVSFFWGGGEVELKGYRYIKVKNNIKPFLILYEENYIKYGSLSILCERRYWDLLHLTIEKPLPQRLLGKEMW